MPKPAGPRHLLALALALAAAAAAPPPLDPLPAPLCVPEASRRAYVTAVLPSDFGSDHLVGALWSVRVLAASIRTAGGQGDIVAVIPPNAGAVMSATMLDDLRGDGILPVSLPRSLFDVHAASGASAESLLSKLAAWSLTRYVEEDACRRCCCC